MRGLLAFALLCVLAGCELAIIEAIDQEGALFLERGEVAEVLCPSPLSAGELGQCEARNAWGATLAHNGDLAAKWGTSDPATVGVEAFSGLITAHNPGSAWIVAEGTNNSADSTLVTVQDNSGG